jgi:acyl phosphate:glycerol-3-phosphate acyltransferase
MAAEDQSLSNQVFFEKPEALKASNPILKNEPNLEIGNQLPQITFLDGNRNSDKINPYADCVSLEIKDPMLIPICLILSAYLLGSLPFGLYVGLWKGVDPRKAGSGNIGATNVGRLLDGKYFALVTLLDMLKSLIPTLAAGYFLSQYGDTRLHYVLWVSVGVAAILGHVFSIFLKFKGGKGVATAAGVLLGIYPYYTFPAFVAIALFIAAFMIWRYVSLASIVACGLFPVIYVLFAILVFHKSPMGQQLPLLIVSVLLAALIILKHRSNIKRLLNGTENKIAQKS